MADKGEVYKCEACGKIVGVFLGGPGELSCCDAPMVKLVEGVVDRPTEVVGWRPIVMRHPEPGRQLARAFEQIRRDPRDGGDAALHRAVRHCEAQFRPAVRQYWVALKPRL